VFLDRFTGASRALARIIHRCWRSTDTVSSLRGKPLPAALNGPLPCRPSPDPLQRCLFLPLGPERTRNVSLSAASMARPSARTEKSRRTETVRCQRAGTLQGIHRDWRFKDSGYATLPGSDGERDLRRHSVFGERGREAHCAGLRSGPAFLVKRGLERIAEGIKRELCRNGRREKQRAGSIRLHSGQARSTSIRT
jgi:hypothetical protein